MPELPDIANYLSALETRVLHQPLQRVRLASPFLLRTFAPPLPGIEGRKVVALRRLGKRIVFGFEGDLWLVLHLMIAGRLHWREPGEKRPPRTALVVFEFTRGMLFLTEAGTKKRASLHLVAGENSLQAHDPGGLEVLHASLEAFAAAVRRESHTVKRTLTDPRIFSGIGNAYGDEILHAARLSPIQLTKKLSSAEVEHLFVATRATLTMWTERLRAETGDGFPEKVTAFRPDMAVHGKFGQPCPVCGAPVQRIRYAENETNYCPRCQTGGRVLADRVLSRLLKDDWPRTWEELDDGIRRPPT